MLSLKTCIELAYVIENLNHGEVDRIFHVFDLKVHIYPPSNLPKTKKVNLLFDYIKTPSIKGPFGNSFQMDMLQYIIEQYYRGKNPDNIEYKYMGLDTIYIEYDELFTVNHASLTNSLKRDGYIVKGRTIKKLLPQEIEEARIENELVTLLDKFEFIVAKGHLEQGIDNHSNGNWAGANAQFRPFIESLLIGISKHILPANQCDSAATAIKLLSSTANPPFLKMELNEVENPKCDKPFVEGFWKRLHPEGAHPGLSDEQDSTFRYHTAIVFAHYLLRRLEKRK